MWDILVSDNCQYMYLAGNVKVTKLNEKKLWEGILVKQVVYCMIHVLFRESITV